MSRTRWHSLVSSGCHAAMTNANMSCRTASLFTSRAFALRVRVISFRRSSCCVRSDLSKPSLTIRAMPCAIAASEIPVPRRLRWANVTASANGIAPFAETSCTRIQSRSDIQLPAPSQSIRSVHSCRYLRANRAIAMTSSTWSLVRGVPAVIPPWLPIRDSMGSRLILVKGNLKKIVHRGANGRTAPCTGLGCTLWWGVRSSFHRQRP